MKQKTVKFSNMVNTTSQRKALTLEIKALEHHKPENPLNPYSIKITYPLNSRELILRTKTTKRAITEATIKFDNLKGTLILKNVQKEEQAEFCLHELVEMEITDVIDKVFENVSNIKTEMNVAHFLTALSLNEYYFIVKLWNPFQNYIECDREADFETETSFPARKEYLFGKAQKSGEKLGKEFNLNSIPSNRLEIVSYGLSVPKTVNKQQTKVKEKGSEKICE